MLSKKMAFSLMSLITLLALAFAVPSVMAADPKEFVTTLERDSANVDGRDVKITITFAEVVSLAAVQDVGIDDDDVDDGIEVIIVNDDFTSKTYTLTGAVVATYPGPDGKSETVEGFGPVAQKDLDLSTAGVQSDGKTFEFTIPKTEILRAGFKKDGITPEATQEVSADKIYVSIPGGIAILDPGKTDISIAKTLSIDLRTVPQEQDRNTPKVVSIQRLRPGSQTVVAAFQEAKVTGPFHVRIVLTEKPDTFTVDYIKVENGTVKNFVTGEKFAWVGGMRKPEDDFIPDRGKAVKPHPLEGKYNHDGVVTESFGDNFSKDDRYHPLLGVPEGEDEMKVPLPTGPDGMYYQYRVEIFPHRRAKEVKVSVKEFHDGDSPRNYYGPDQVGNKPNGREQLALSVNIPKFDLDDGLRVDLPHSEGAQITYAGSAGHYILTRNKDGSGIRYFHEKDQENIATRQTPAQLLYNVRASTGLPNLERFLANNGTIHLVSYNRNGVKPTDTPKYEEGDAYISEVMWGTDASQNPVDNSNWIEIRNGTTSAIGVGDKLWALWFYEAHETPAPAYPADTAYEGPTGQAGEIIDAIGTKASDTGLSWRIAGKGQSGRSNVDIARAEEHVLASTVALKSMYRVTDATTGEPADGTMESSWMETPDPSVNIAVAYEDAIVATPGAAPFGTADITKAEEDAAKAEADADAATAQAAADQITNTGTYPTLGQGRVYISEVMFAGGGVLPQWIEISNGDRSAEFNLSGWTLTVDNAAADADVSVGATATFTIPDGTKIAPSEPHDPTGDNTPSTILVVTETGRNNITGPNASGQIINLEEDNEVELILAGVVRGKYTLLSAEAFLITLAPPEPAATKAPAGETAAAKATRQANEKKAANERKAATDMVGNLGADGAAAWALPMSGEGGRSSIIRRHIQVVRGPAAPEDGMMIDNWALAALTAFGDVTHIRVKSHYGALSDDGTPGFRTGGALPVELSHFRPARDKVTGTVAITWSTQSELNNAGFFIKRSQQKDGEFQIINATMIAGAGTTSEKQSYTYTDTTAQPNVVYYYQIEDVSLDGNHQTLTRGVRLKGHVSVAGKATLTWGELKTSNE